MTKVLSPCLFVHGCGGSILYGKDLLTGKTTQIYPKLLGGDKTSQRFMLVDLDSNANTHQRD